MWRTTGEQDTEITQFRLYSTSPETKLCYIYLSVLYQLANSILLQSSHQIVLPSGNSMQPETNLSLGPHPQHKRNPPHKGYVDF
jgi:hypothetical protein